MNKIYLLSGLVAIFLAQTAFADDMTADSKPCVTIAKACLTAGYSRNDESHTGKFWFDCMKPVMLGKTVAKVTVDPATVKACRVDKIDQLKKELSEFQKA